MKKAPDFSFNIEDIRKDFPCLQQNIYGQPLVFLDSAASAQKPQVMIDTLTEVYARGYANIHRGSYYLSNKATEQYEATRSHIASFINASSANEIIFTKSATESINLVAHGLAQTRLQKGDEILISQMEHHANIIPWQQACLKTGAILRVIPLTADDQIDMHAYQQLLSKKTKLVAITHMSNVLGTVTPIKEIIQLAHQAGSLVLIDACQSIVHFTLDVQALECDFLVFSAHKLYGPNGVGILYGKSALLEEFPPYQTGGEMVADVAFGKTNFREPPFRFEAGTPVIAEVIAFSASLTYLEQLNRTAIQEHEATLLAYAAEEINRIKGFKIIGHSPHKAGLISFIHQKAHPSDIGMILDQCGIAIRSGHHCAIPLHTSLGLNSTARMSLAMYNNEQDIEKFLDGLIKVNRLLGE